MGVAPRISWVLLAYRLPREPSGPRVALWRKLRRLGAVQLLDGLVALPADARTKEMLEWLAEDVIAAGGEATVWTGSPASAADERGIATRMAEVIAEEYRSVLAAAGATDASETSRKRTVLRLRRELEQIGRRDFFSSIERDEAHRAVRQLAAELEAVVQ